MNCSSNNGRVDIMQPDTNTLFSMQDKMPINDCNSDCRSYKDAMIGNWYNTSLSDTFFSKDNIQILQNGIRAGVYKQSNNQFVIGSQNCDSLKIIMRSIFLQHANNQPTNILQQIDALNQRVWDYSIPQVFGEAQGYIQYKKDVSTMYTPIDYPAFADKNDKTLELKHFFSSKDGAEKDKPYVNPLDGLTHASYNFNEAQSQHLKDTTTTQSLPSNAGGGKGAGAGGGSALGSNEGTSWGL
jgi:hypothetical protein